MIKKQRVRNGREWRLYDICERHGWKLRVSVESEEVIKRIHADLDGVPIETLVAPPCVPQ